MKTATILLLCFACSVATAQDATRTEANAARLTSPQDVALFQRSAFHKGIVKAARQARKAGTITRGQQTKVQVAMLSPAFRKHAEDLAVIQMAFSGSDEVPMTEAGFVDRAAIDWDGLILFLEKLIPLILQLLEIFGGLG